jgi:predicted GNAT family N-acyltransferase
MAFNEPSPQGRARALGRSEQARVHAWPADTLEVVQGSTDLEEIERFRYSIYVAEQHKPLPAADHRASRLPDADDSAALHFCVRNDARSLVGYARMHYAQAIPAATVSRLGLGDLLGDSPQSLGFISKLMVDRSLRGRTNAVRLIMSMIQYGCDRFPEAEGAVFHCSSELVPLYTRMGFRPFGRPFVDPHVGLQTPMVAIFRDLEHFEECGSPIALIVQDLSRAVESSERFYDYFLVKRGFQPDSQRPANAPRRQSFLKSCAESPPCGALDPHVKLA